MGDPFDTGSEKETVTWSFMFVVVTVVGASAMKAQSKVVTSE
jgi:hypothetical protein